jgi:hypothetical protein
VSAGETISVEVKRALELDAAFAVISGEDRRPLLVLRECLTCTGTDDALLTKNADNEKTMLMSRWFKCVKLPPAVIEKDHPFHNVFADDEESHLFVARWDGSSRLDLNGQQSRTELWKKMGALLKSEYAKKHEPVIKSLLRVLDDLDEVDQKLAAADGRFNDVIEDDGPKSRKAKKIQKELTKLRNEKSELRARAIEAGRLPLRAPVEHARADQGATTSTG